MALVRAGAARFTEQICAGSSRALTCPDVPLGFDGGRALLTVPPGGARGADPNHRARGISPGRRARGSSASRANLPVVRAILEAARRGDWLAAAMAVEARIAETGARGVWLDEWSEARRLMDAEFPPPMGGVAAVLAFRDRARAALRARGGELKPN